MIGQYNNVELKQSCQLLMANTPAAALDYSIRVARVVGVVAMVAITDTGVDGT